MSKAFAVVLLLLLDVGPLRADTIHVAVASNFASTMQEIAAQFGQTSGHRLVLSVGSTGKQYAQIINGAPFDAFFAADWERPALLEAQGIAVPGTRFSYALGRLVLWSPTPDLVDARGQVLRRDTFRYLAIANPKLAPYGVAAKQVLQAQGLWESLQQRMVRGENIAQAFNFVRSGNAELGFVAYSQVLQPGVPADGSLWEPPHSLYDPIEQQAVLLQDTPAARALMEFVRSAPARAIIRAQGYRLP